MCVNITGKASDIFSPLEQAEDSELDSEPKLLEVRGSWILEREVGAGCFGRVTLWRNMVRKKLACLGGSIVLVHNFVMILYAYNFKT